ncbi:MAG: 4Fe-4S binding protein [Sulfurospirillaceae bacterium]|nr:4Fe-4S binding protein [Sulfurospirillaceae bacterium]MDD3462319.1 4Fe-4S binding protein [Sulfurospirillaceae bacterium]
MHLAENRREAFASLASRFKKKKEGSTSTVALIRPPYNRDEVLFEQFCVSCEQAFCVEACEQSILALDNKHIPYVLFAKTGCTFCEECVKACPHQVLMLEEGTLHCTIKADFNIDINACVAWKNVVCSACRDVCNDRAVVFFGLFRPVIDMEKCSACGFCYGVCPVNAIQFKKRV